MQRAATITRTAVPALVAVLTAGGLTACSAGPGDGEPAAAGGDGAVDVPTPRPGRYTRLPEPCGAVPAETLRELLPGGDEQAYAGDRRVTYDTGRRVGCDWRTASAPETYGLSVDMLRVVSYDPAVSDDDQAVRDFGERADAAGVPGTEGTAGGTGTGGGDTAPRLLDGIGSAAFLDDRLTGQDSAPTREINLTFRSANVIVTVQYAVSTSAPGDVPSSEPLQERVSAVARQLADGFDA
ncbi:DUF3558 domain-containing protein [Streptomyces sp. RFCAC02]|uniref:DUF3558 domain-containing protein n=1 Tax=Streptomyces sp. RFCAC02 TaxID=2499143 RepID=UPI001F117759|nr:DUF3558 domain-containing protein [Streptomyces sp. RFCAC02]